MFLIVFWFRLSFNYKESNLDCSTVFIVWKSLPIYLLYWLVLLLLLRAHHFLLPIVFYDGRVWLRADLLLL